LKPYDTFTDETVEVYAYDIDKPDRLIWRCTFEQAEDLSKISEMVKAQGYTFFELRKMTEVKSLYEIDGGDALSEN